MLGESKRGAQNQSMVPPVETKAAVCMFPIKPWSAINGYFDISVLDSHPSGCDHAVSVLRCQPHPHGVISSALRSGIVLRRKQVAQVTQNISSSAKTVLAPLALAQFICSFAGSNMNVMITDISTDLNTTVQGVQVAITIFLLVMAALMIPGGKLTDRYGRKRCFMLGLIIYGVGALLSAVSPGLGVLILGNSILEGVGTALLIPPVYILATLLFTEFTSRARAFGVISAMGGIGPPRVR